MGIKTTTTLDIEGIFRRNVDTVYRVAVSYLKSPVDAEDITQQTFMKLVTQPRAFENAEHEKAWLIACTVNACKDLLKSANHARIAEMPEDMEDQTAHAEASETLDAIMALPERHRVSIYLHYYEGYKADEIAELMGSTASTVRNWLSEGRNQLRTSLGSE